VRLRFFQSVMAKVLYSHGQARDI